MRKKKIKFSEAYRLDKDRAMLFALSKKMCCTFKKSMLALTKQMTLYTAGPNFIHFF